MFSSATWDAKPQRRTRRRTNRKYRGRDHSHGRYWQHRYFERDWRYFRAKTHTDTGYGVAYIRNPALNDM